MIAARAEHAEVLAALHATSFPRAWKGEEFAALLRQPGLAGWIAVEKDGTPLGFIVVRAAADEAEILTLAVDPAQRRKGHASALLDAAFAGLCTGATTQLFLEVAADNDAAIALYETHGFSICGRRPAYYAGAIKPTDAILMRRKLGG